jgi:L,D-transpeptidase YcbB
MNTRSLFVSFICLFITLFVIPGCHHTALPRHDIVTELGKLDASVSDNISNIVNYAKDNEGHLANNPPLFRENALDSFYLQHQYQPQWSHAGKETTQADSLLAVIRDAGYEGLDPVNFRALRADSLLNGLTVDSTEKRDAAGWARLDVWLTDAFMKLAVQLHYGVLPKDSISLRKDSTFSNIFLIHLLDSTLQNNAVKQTVDSLQPHYPQYWLLKSALKQFRQQFAGREWDTLPVDYTDTASFQQLLAKRLLEGDELDSSGMNDDRKIKAAVKIFQEDHNLYPDGVAGKNTITALNVSKAYRIKQIAVNLERWREFPDSLPTEYILVNIPGYELQLWDRDTLRIDSKVIVGAPKTRTPLLNSHLGNFVIYPYWRVPFSIIVKEILPKLKRGDTGYLRKENFEVIDRHNNAVNPATINWKRYNKYYFPFVLQQSEGLDNSLGILKFNFYNKYSVYLHDTNARYLFGNTYRALSHGCVRVQEWQKMLYYLIKDDTAQHLPDSVKVWLTIQQKRQVSFTNRVPVYFRYFTCMVKKDRLYFYDDIYGEDKTMMKELHFQ